MKIYYTVSRIYVWAFFLTFFCGLLPTVSKAQLKTIITDYGIFGGTSSVLAGQTAPAAPGYGVILGPSSNIQGGNVGSYKLVQSTGSIICGISSAKTNIYSGGTIVLGNSNSVTGKITAAGSTGTVLSVGTSASLNTDSIIARGNIVIGSGTVTGTVINPPGSIYRLNNVIINNTKGTPNLPVLPSMPPITPDVVAGTANKTSGSIDPGHWGNLTLGNNGTVTLNGPGKYYFKAITTTGPNSTIVYDFKNAPAGDFLIYVVGDVNLNRTNFRIVNGGSATRIYMEVQGKGLTNTADRTAAFIMSNGSNGTGNTSGWFGALWVPYAGIKIGTPNGPLMTVNGSLWSGTQVNLVSNVKLTYAQFGGLCTPPVVDAGPDKPFNFNGITTLSGNSGTGGGTFKWTAPAGGGFTTGDNLAMVNVIAPGVYQLTYTAPDGCSSTDEVLVSNKIRSLLGSELTSVYYNNPTGLPSPFFMIADGKIRIDVIVKVNNYDYVLNLLQQTSPINYGLTNIITNGENGDGKRELIITGDYPIVNLLKLNDLGDYINYCRPFYEPFSSVGIVTSAGDTTMRSHFVRNGYGIDGTDINVGVISNSFNTITNATTAAPPPFNPVPGPAQTFTTNTAAQDLTNGDLSAVTVLQDYPVRSTDEGRAMLQIVHDVAPGAKLYFRTGFLTAGDFATAIKELRLAGCQVIVDDISYINEPYLTDGVVAQAVNEVKAAGVSYFSAAGNFANKSYEANFRPANAPAIAFPVGTKAHDFSGTGDIFQHITMAPGNYTIVLQWVDDIYSNGQFDGTHYDLDMFWTSNTNGTALKGFNRDNTDGDPVEIMPFIIDQVTDANFLIVNNTTGVGNPERIKFMIYRGDVQILEWGAGTSTLVGQQNALGAIAVGAARYDKAPPYLATPLIESFSSIGGTMTEGVVRNKPDLVAPDGVNTTVRMGQDYPNSALDGYSNFFGTSAAAPHAAAVAALIMHGKKKFKGQATTSPDEIRTLLQSTAVDMETASNLPSTKFDYISGYGLVDADSAMRTFAAPKATLIELVVPPAQVPCIGGPFTITIRGENFSRNTIVLLINTPDTTRIIPTFISSTEVTVTISSCNGGNPEIRAYTPPKAGTNGTDGGYSNSKFFFSASVTITAPKIFKKYGETLVPLSPEIKVGGVLLANTNPLLTLADLGLDIMTITTAANSSSDVGTYIVTPSRTFDPAIPADLALLRKYSYTFTTGLVTIEKMPLTVTPVTKTVDYGHSIGKIDFTYVFNTANVTRPDSVRNAIKTYHEALLPGNALAVVKDFGKQQANGSTLSSTDLTNMNMIASFNAVKNSRKFTLSNDQLVPITDPNVLQDNLNIQYLVDVASESIYKYKLNPATANFFPGYPGINSKALLGAAAIQSDNNTVGVIVDVNGSLQKCVGGTLEQMLSSTNGPIVPMVNGLLIQVVDAQTVPPSENNVQYVNDGSWVQITSGGALIKMVSGDIKLANGTFIKLVAGETYVKFANGSLQKVVSGSLLKMVAGSNTVVYLNDDPVKDSTLVSLSNGLVQYLSGSLQKVVSGSLQKFVSGTLVKMVAGTLVKMVASSELGTDAINNNTGVIVDEEDAAGSEPIFALGSMYGINMITGLDIGTQYLVPGILANPNFDITYGLGQVVIEKATITVKANNVSRPYGENNQLTVSYTGFAPGDSVGNEGNIGIKSVTGVSPTVTTTATQYSQVSPPTYPITVSGTLASPKYDFEYVAGELTVTNNPCLKTHDPTNFVNTTNAPTSLWLNITIKVSGQLAANGNYIMYRAGTVTFNNININSVPVTTHDIPNGKIIAVTGRTSPFTYFDLGTNTWITEVPPGYASTSDVFISGSIINSTNGFIKKNSQSNVVVKGIFYSDKSFSDQWAYAMAAYQRPAAQGYYLTYPFINGTNGGGVVSTNGNYRAGTPTPAISYIVAGGSGNGGNNYTGSSSNQNNFTACIPASASAVNRGTNAPITSVQEAVRQELLQIPTIGEIKVFPNPAFAEMALSYVPTQTGTSKIAIFTIDGRKVMETNNGVWEAGKKYIRMIDVSRLARGVYLIQVIDTDKITNTKFIISR